MVCVSRVMKAVRGSVEHMEVQAWCGHQRPTVRARLYNAGRQSDHTDFMQSPPAGVNDRHVQTAARPAVEQSAH